jgi:hypothetical protein
MSKTVKTRTAELNVGDLVPDGFTLLRGASRMSYVDGASIIYRRHFWYITLRQDMQTEVVKHVCVSYFDARAKFDALVEEQEQMEAYNAFRHKIEAETGIAARYFKTWDELSDGDKAAFALQMIGI